MSTHDETANGAETVPLGEEAFPAPAPPSAQSAQPTPPARPTPPAPAPGRPGADRPDGPDAPSDRRSGARTGPRSGSIVWGVLVLAFCAYVVQRVLAPGTVDAALWVTGTLLGLGAVLLIVGFGLLLRRER